jgi:hypothetical protein
MLPRPNTVTAAAVHCRPSHPGGFCFLPCRFQALPIQTETWTMKNSNQRIILSDAHDFQVRQIALKESRSITNTLTKLIEEALSARRQANTTVDRLVSLLKATAGTDAAEPASS